MKKNAVIILAVIAISVASVKTGYAFYGKQISNNNVNVPQVTTTNSLGNTKTGITKTEFLQGSNIQEEDTQDRTSITRQSSALDPTLAASGQADDSLSQGSCCGSGSVNMLDENGNLIDRDSFTKELEDAVKNGEITEDDKEYYLNMYDQCAVIFGTGSDSTQSGASSGGNGGFPSCH
ncbi:hypothetical protein QA584_12120 [Anaerocolumna sp. AGMB13025]|uniref:hypothetical protein n=1 Tax=Anaerocolumna sp. AGMB13025 TaxID=3039116 RepID=UPI00241C9D73|nr:hypothetical protein [Anaerocolumna sp. AGMB13025]WFR59792.1 hypothetical protein QA584_12120 [Anaerocolumna sp. AGMB13025]